MKKEIGQRYKVIGRGTFHSFKLGTILTLVEFADVEEVAEENVSWYELTDGREKGLRQILRDIDNAQPDVELID